MPSRGRAISRTLSSVRFAAECRNVSARCTRRRAIGNRGWKLGESSATLRRMDLETRILIVDDDEGIRTLIGSFLEKHGFRVDTAANPAAMRDALAARAYSLIVLDVMMPGEDGLSALRRLQQERRRPPVIMLSAVGTDVDRIVGLEMGADDYLPKPCNPRELLARIRTVLRRSEPPETGEAVGEAAREAGLHFAGWRMDVVAQALTNPAGEPVILSDGEFRLLRAFVEHPRRVLTRDQLLDYARGADSEHYDRAIDVQVSRLRRRLGATKADGELIRTVRNEGYMFTPVVTKH
jgi:two-component system, OmpR family, response regulator